MSKKTKLSPPWVEFCAKMQAFFGQDPDIQLRYVEEPKTIRVYVNNQEKADALMALLPLKKTFGEVDLYIHVIPSNKELKEDKGAMFKAALENNPIFAEMIDIEGVFVNPIHYCVFKKEVAQYWGDNLGDPHGNVSTLYQEIAKDIFGESGGVIFCTDNK